jgi:phage shock protein PspC (stress-responsive transcriptional regulator)
MGLVLYLALWVIMPNRPRGPVEVMPMYRRVE